MTRDEFSALCRAGTVLLDGATGTNLIRAGMPRGVCTEAWVLEHPAVLRQLQSAYAMAGSQIVYAPTFCANRVSLRQFGLDGRLREMNRALVALSREAVGADVLVAGDMTTLGRPVEEAGTYSYASLLSVYREQAETLLEAGADLFAVETMMGVSECMAAVEAIRSVCDKPVICTLSVQSDGKCYFDGSAAEAAPALEALGADAVGVNCASGPDQLESVMAMMRRACRLPVVAKPNAGLPKILDDGTAVYSMDAPTFAAHMKKLIAVGAGIVGGCCGTTPEYIAALKRIL